MFPLHALPFGFWIIMTSPGFSPSDDAIQNVITFTNILLQKTADVLAVSLMLFCQMLAHLPCGGFVEPKNVMREIISCTVTKT